METWVLFINGDYNMGQTKFSFGSCTFDHLIKADTFKISPNSRQDLDSYRDTNGLLHRNALSHTATVVEFDTIPMWDTKFSAMMNAITSSYTNYNERSGTGTYFDEENQTTKSGNFYLDSNFQVAIKQQWGDRTLYDSCHFKFVEY